MGLIDRLRAIVEPMPADASVTFSVAWLRDLLAAVSVTEATFAPEHVRPPEPSLIGAADGPACLGL